MAGEFTAQEQQNLFRIREQMALANAEFADAVDTRRQLEAQLSEVQREMASPDGIATSQRFVEDVSRLRREIQVAAAREQEADTNQSRLSAQESQSLAIAARSVRNIPKPTSAPSVVRAGVMGTIDRGTWSGIIAAYRQRRQNYKTTKRRERMAAKAAAGKLNPPSKIIYFPLIYLAVSADVLGIFAQLVNLTGVGAFFVSAVSFCFGVFFFVIGIFLNRKIKATLQIGNDFAKTVSTLERRIMLIRQSTTRLAKYATRSARKRSLVRTTWKRNLVLTSARKISTWAKEAGRFMRYAQVVLEAIPFINMIPWFTINMLLIYRERKQQYTTAMETAAQYVPIDAQEDSAFADMEAVDAERIKSFVVNAA